VVAVSFFNFIIAEETLNLCKQVDISFLSKERVEGELKDVFSNALKPALFFIQLQKMNKLEPFFNELNLEFNETLKLIDQGQKYISFINDKYVFNLCLLMIKMPQDKISTFFNRFSNDKKVMNKINNLLKALKMVENNFTNNTIIKLAFVSSKDELSFKYLLCTVYNKELKLEDIEIIYNDYLKEIKTFDITGNDLKNIGIANVRKYKFLLNKALMLHFDGFNKQTILERLITDE
jgi:tRNA nucleotidyltransferase (CCA-adding enzyme)